MSCCHIEEWLGRQPGKILQQRLGMYFHPGEPFQPEPKSRVPSEVGHGQPGCHCCLGPSSVRGTCRPQPAQVHCHGL
jgi:hypothetical protein